MNQGVVGLVKGKTLKEIDEEIPLPASFEKCENTPHSQRPDPLIAPEGFSRLKFSKEHPPILTMKRSAGKPVQELRRWKSLSYPGPNGISILDLKVKWYYEPPIGSSPKPQYFEDEIIDTVVDTVGKHILALRVEDESGACAVHTFYFTVIH